MPIAPNKATKTPFAEVELGDNILKPEAPIVRCRIVYMGNNRNRSVARTGHIQIQRIQTGFDEKNEPVFETVKTAIDEGIQNYDFASHDALGRLIEQRLMPVEAGPEIAGKPFAYCEHLGHIRWFYLQTTVDGAREFKVLAERKDQPLIQDYVRRFMRAQQEDEKTFQEVAG